MGVQAVVLQLRWRAVAGQPTLVGPLVKGVLVAEAVSRLALAQAALDVVHPKIELRNAEAADEE